MLQVISIEPPIQKSIDCATKSFVTVDEHPPLKLSLTLVVSLVTQVAMAKSRLL